MDQIISTSDSDISIFREWLQMQFFLPQDVDDNMIRAFIVGAKGSIQQAKIRFDNYFKSQQTLDDVMDDFDPFSENMKKMNNLLAICSIPGKEYSLVITKLLSSDSTEFTVPGYFVRHYYNTQTQLWDNTLGNCQTIYILDFERAGFGHVKGVTPVLAEKFVSAILNSSPLRFKAIYLVNLPSVIEWAINIFQQFLPAKLKNRLHVLSSVEDLKNDIDMKYLPEDYGGQKDSVQALYEKHLGRLQHYRSKFIAEKSKRDSEAKIRPKENGQLPGTFRKLTID